MILKGTTAVEVDVDDVQIFTRVIKIFEKKFDLPEGVFLSDDTTAWMHRVEYHTSHSWIEIEKYRDVQPNDFNNIKVLDALRETRNQYD